MDAAADFLGVLDTEAIYVVFIARAGPLDDRIVAFVDKVEHLARYCLHCRRDDTNPCAHIAAVRHYEIET